MATVSKEPYDQLHLDFIERGRKIAELEEKLAAQEETHAKEIFRLNDKCVAIRRGLETAMRKAIGELKTAEIACADSYGYGNIKWARGLLERRLDPKTCTEKAQPRLPVECPNGGNHQWQSVCQKCGMTISFNLDLPEVPI